jgi:hypothetical protein
MFCHGGCALNQLVLKALVVALAVGGAPASVGAHRWRAHCRGLYQTPIAA